MWTKVVLTAVSTFIVSTHALADDWQARQSACNQELIVQLKDRTNIRANFRKEFNDRSERVPGYLPGGGRLINRYEVTARDPKTGDVIARAECMIRPKSHEIVTFRMLELNGMPIFAAR